MSDAVLSRRRLLQAGGVSALVLGLGSTGLLSACGSGGGSSGEATDRLVYSGFGGSYETSIRKALFDPFAQSTGVTVEFTPSANDITKIITMVNAGRTDWDLDDAQGVALAQLIAAGALEELDPSIVTAADIVEPSLATPYSIPYYQFSHNVFWNTSMVSRPMTSWADVWNVEEFPGKRGFQRVPWFTLEIALVADGVPVDQLYPLDVDRAFASLDRIKPHAVFLDNNALTNAVAAQELVTADLNLARIKTIRDSGVPLEYTWNQAMLDVQQLVVLKGAPNRVNAMRAVQYSLTEEAQLAILDELGYTPTLKSALAKIDPERAKDLPGTPETSATSFYLNPQWWAENYDSVAKRFQD